MYSFCLLVLSFVILIYKNVLLKQINSCHVLNYAYFKGLRFPVIFIYLCACVWLPWWLNDRESPCNAGNQVYSWVWKILWERKCQPTSLFLSGKSPEQRSLVGYPPWCFKREEHDLAIKHSTNTHTNICLCVVNVIDPHFMNSRFLSLLGRQLKPVFLPGKSHGQRSLAGLQLMGSQGVGQDLVDSDEQQLAFDEPVCSAGREMQT